MKKRITNAVLALVLCCALAVPAFAVEPDAPSAWAVEDVNEAIGLGLVPESLQSRYTQPIKRAEFCALAVTLIERVFDVECPARKRFADTDDVNVEKAATAGIVKGVGDGKFEPDAGLTREQAATILCNLAYCLNNSPGRLALTYSDEGDISDWALDAVERMKNIGIMGGVGGHKFDPKGSFTIEQSILSVLRMYRRPLSGSFVDPTYKAWMLGCSAILSARNNGIGFPYDFGMHIKNDENAEKQKSALANDWGVENREDLIETIERMTDHGHNEAFAEAYEMVTSLTDAEFDELLALSSDTDKYMWPQTKNLGDKWGDKQIKAWDWYRMIHLAGWGYIAGYLELDEVYECMDPVIERLKSTFSSWEEANENYTDGYAWWSRTDVNNIAGTEYERRLGIYEDLKTDERLYDPDIWE